MKRFALGSLLAISMLLATFASAGADSLPAGQEWAGGNGWCGQDVCFRAWPVEGGVQLSWVVERQPAPVLRVLRLTPGQDTGKVIEVSGGTGEFSLLDDDVQAGATYLYQLLVDDAALGEPLEAGIATQKADPSESTGFRVFVPLAL